MTWVKFDKRFARIFSFSHPRGNLSVFCDNSKVNSIEHPNNWIYKTQCALSTSNNYSISAETELKLNEWIHLAFVSNNNSLRLYLNSSLKAKTPFDMFQNEYFESNYIGKQNGNNFEEYSITYDEIKIFQRALNEYELRKQNGLYESKKFFEFKIKTILISRIFFRK